MGSAFQNEKNKESSYYYYCDVVLQKSTTNNSFYVRRWNQPSPAGIEETHITCTLRTVVCEEIRDVFFARCAAEIFSTGNNEFAKFGNSWSVAAWNSRHFTSLSFTSDCSTSRSAKMFHSFGTLLFANVPTLQLVYHLQAKKNYHEETRRVSSSGVVFRIAWVPSECWSWLAVFFEGCGLFWRKAAAQIYEKGVVQVWMQLVETLHNECDETANAFLVKLNHNDSRLNFVAAFVSHGFMVNISVLLVEPRVFLSGNRSELRSC